MTEENKTDLTSELIKAVKNQKRPEIIKAPIYGLYSSEERTFVYSDDDKRYETCKMQPSNKKVRSVKAFALSIAEELKRRQNETGSKATVNINLSGGIFIPDDNFGQYLIEFHRLNSPQWNLIKDYINRTVDHTTFLLLLSGLKPSIENAGYDFQKFFSQFAVLRVSGNKQITSNPIMIENEQTKSYKYSYRLESGEDGEEKIPAGFEIKVPFAKAGDYEYIIPIDLLYARNEDDELTITILCPTFEKIEEDAIIDEAQYIKNETEKYSELLILSDF